MSIVFISRVNMNSVSKAGVLTFFSNDCIIKLTLWYLLSKIIFFYIVEKGFKNIEKAIVIVVNILEISIIIYVVFVYL